MSDVMEYKCPNCGGFVEFDSSTQRMKCPYCDSEFDVESLRAMDEALDKMPPDDIKWSDTPKDEWSEEECEKFAVFVCNSCGGEIIADDNTGATSCPYCGNPVVLSQRFAGDLRPDLVIPFKLDKDAARGALSSHLNGKRLLPKPFRSENHIDEVKGLYVPFWLFGGKASADIRCEGTKKQVWSDADYNYTRTSYYDIARAGTLEFDAVPVDGSSQMPDELMESIEPYRMSDAVDFQTAYLSGYLADKYDVDVDATIEKANSRIKNTTLDAFSDTITGYSTVRTKQASVQVANGRARYALMPVWLLQTTWRGQNFQFVMNGQTGAFAGDLPVDSGAATRWTLGLLGGITAALLGIFFLLYLFAGVDAGGGIASLFGSLLD